ncbi:calcium-binding protein [Streptomyces violaceus]|uniref:calcium-binding protein n=1 Tax=Streptomyces violaceus TaxID=1936 RepID=UPI00382FD851
MESGNAIGGGSDFLYGRDGQDFLHGDSVTRNGNASGGGNDRLFGGDGHDDLIGDSWSAGGGNASGGGNDHLEGGAINDTMIGDSVALGGDAQGAGDDEMLGDAGGDLMVGDTVATQNAYGAGGDDLIDQGEGLGDFMIGDHNISNPRGGTAFSSGNDRIIGSDESNPLFGEEALVGDSTVGRGLPPTAGNDVISGRGGNDLLFGDNTNFAGSRTVGRVGGNDELDGGDGVDTLLAGPANDSLDGGPGAPDFCNGEGGIDTAIRCETLRRIP